MLLYVDTVEEGRILQRVSSDVSRHACGIGLMSYDSFDQVASAANQNIRQVAQTVKSGQELVCCLSQFVSIDHLIYWAMAQVSSLEAHHCTRHCSKHVDETKQ